MNAFVPYLAALHQRDLLDEARAMRKQQLASGPRSNVSTWRRSLGSAFASAARSLDPSVETGRTTGRTRDGGVERALAS
jgi:hypothetical protein